MRPASRSCRLGWSISARFVGRHFPVRSPGRHGIRRRRAAPRDASRKIRIRASKFFPPHRAIRFAAPGHSAHAQKTIRHSPRVLCRAISLFPRNPVRRAVRNESIGREINISTCTRSGKANLRSANHAIRRGGDSARREHRGRAVQWRLLPPKRRRCEPRLILDARRRADTCVSHRHAMAEATRRKKVP